MGHSSGKRLEHPPLPYREAVELPWLGPPTDAVDPEGWQNQHVEITPQQAEWAGKQR